MFASELQSLGQVLKLMLCAGADPFAAVEKPINIRGKYQSEQHSWTVEEVIRVAFFKLQAGLPRARYDPRNRQDGYTSFDVSQDVQRHKASIEELGQRLLVILNKQQKKKKFWRRRISHGIEVLKGHRIVLFLRNIYFVASLILCPLRW